MTSPNRDIIDEIKSKLDIVNVIGEEIELQDEGGGHFVGSVPPVGHSGKSLKVDQNLQIWHDMKNSDGGDVFDWIGRSFSDPRGRDFPEVLRIAAERAGVELIEITAEERERVEVYNLLTKVAGIYHQNLTPELYDTIKEKWGIDRETVDRLQIGYAISGDDLLKLDRLTLQQSGLIYESFSHVVFNHRIIFPYWKNGKVAYMIGRTLDGQPKYLKLLVSSEKYPEIKVQNSCFYGEDSLRGVDYCIITEGVTDCIVMLQAGFPCISPVTVQFREKDHTKLISLTRELKCVYICNDNEENEAGIKGALKTAEALERARIETRLIILPKPEGCDKIDIADYMKEYSPEDFKKLMDSSMELCDYLLEQQVISTTSTSTTRLKAFKVFAVNDLSFMPDDEWEVFVKNEVAKKFRLNKTDINKVFAAIEKERQKKNRNEAGEQKTQENGEEGEEESTRYKLPPLEERLKAYPEEVIRKANEILDSGDPFLYICDTWNEIHVGDRNLGEMLACSIACTQLLNAGIGIHEKPSGDSESGKSHACLSMGKLCPPWKFRATTFSPKVLYYMPDLIPGTILYTDDIDLSDKGVVSTIKKATADFENETVMDTVIDGKPVTKSIPARIDFWLSSVDSIDDVQLGTRFIYSNTESETGHDHEVNHKQKGRCLGIAPEESSEKVLICRCMLEYICDNLYNVFSAYGFVSTWSEESKKRNQEKFLDVLLSVTVFNYRQRETVHGNLVGTLEDWKQAVSIYSYVAQNNSCMLTDEEIVILHTIHEMCQLYCDGAQHKKLFKELKETNKFKKSESTLKRILLGDTKGKQGFKEKVPGFTYDKVEQPILGENGFEIRGAGKTRALCYSYDGDLFDGLPEGVDVVEAIKNGIFVSCDYEIAEALEQVFKDDPVQVYKLKDNSRELYNWKREYRNQKKPSEISRNQQNSNAQNFASSNFPIVNNNNKNDNNMGRNHKKGDEEGGEINMYPSSPQMEKNTCISKTPLKTVNSVNSANSASANSDQGLISAPCSLNSEASIYSRLREILKRFVQSRYHFVVDSVPEMVEKFNTKYPGFKRELGEQTVLDVANKLNERGWN
ncbi:hypothetical protein EQO05_00180 [Methanosarcina sp. MSH10X1]|uniref:CHC2 zinc finger domain-containing protein n=1 Tax=Methanosarcina sp. MSH10X1 TaxID=2507075 RepID=UPI000FFBE553|nr:CHC2 zinc finger domain-containing protein [Methanosarcina sp. MSH10X1]RXA21712.1 hypothetical protein EQO05_00180 [Methanosarcina sp. MSH10X1]